MRGLARLRGKVGGLAHPRGVDHFRWGQLEAPVVHDDVPRHRDDDAPAVAIARRVISYASFVVQTLTKFASSGISLAQSDKQRDI